MANASLDTLRRTVLGMLVPALVLVIWQVAGSRPGMAGILPTPMLVLEGWHGWIFGSPGMGLNPYLGSWVSNVQYSSMRVAQGFFLAALIGVPLGLLIGWSRLVQQLFDPLIQSLRPIPITLGCRFQLPCSASVTWGPFS